MYNFNNLSLFNINSIEYSAENWDSYIIIFLDFLLSIFVKHLSFMMIVSKLTV